MHPLSEFKTAQDQYKSILDSLADCIVVTDAACVIRECNAASARWMGNPSRQVMGMTVFEFLGDDSPSVRALFERALQSGERISQEILLAGGVFRLDVSPGVFDGAQALICIVKDVTELKK